MKMFLIVPPVVLRLLCRYMLYFHALPGSEEIFYILQRSKVFDALMEFFQFFYVFTTTGGFDDVISSGQIQPFVKLRSSDSFDA